MTVRADDSLPASPFPLSDVVPAGLAAIDEAGRQVYVNEAFSRMVGWSRGELIGATAPFVYWPPEDLPRIKAAFDATLRGDLPAEGFELRFQRRNGSRFDAVVLLGRLEARPPVFAGWVAVVTDVSARTAMRRAVQDAARRMQALQVATSELTATLTREQVADVVMRAAIPAVGGVRGSVAVVSDDGSELEIIATLGYTQQTRDAYRRVPLNFEFPLSDAVLERRALFFSTAESRASRYPHLSDLLAANGGGAMASIPLLSGDRVVGAIGINWADDHVFGTEETTLLQAFAHQCSLALERARLYEDESTARRAAEEANRAKSDFLAAMSHELRTPLNAIAGYVQLLRMGIYGSVPEPQQEVLGRVERSQLHLLSLINDVLNFARLEAGRVEYALESFTLAPVLANVQAMVEPLFHARSLRYSVSVPPDLAVHADCDKLQQILLNLLSNAVKFTNSGGAIVVEAAVTEYDANSVAIRVADTGIGIARDKHGVIFEPFVQVHRNLTRTIDGTGLGLTISRDLARGMGGELGVRSVEGEGSTFTLTLPRAGTGR